MPFKIYTYADPYRIEQTDFWEEIKYYPHLCASRTLVRGLMSVLPDNEIQTLICPFDSIVKDRIFDNWTNNISNRIQQYSELGKLYKAFYKKSGPEGGFGDARYEAFTHNKNAMLDSIRLFIELGISSESLDTHRLNMEHRVFAYVLKLAEKSDIFKLPTMPDKYGIIKHFQEQALLEKEEKIKLHEKGGRAASETFQKDLDLIDRMIDRMEKWDGNNLVIHGVHQFTPLQLRLLTYLDRIGVEIIFLYNYLPEFKEIYSSWNFIYQQFDATIHHDGNISTYHPALQFPRTGMAIATNIALLSEESVSRNDPRLIENYNLYKNEKVVQFDNISEYAGYVSDLFAEAEKRTKETQLARDIPFRERPSTAAVLAHMDDVIYTANNDVDELLQVYHPEYARNRHFLAYPIGQFFVALYSLWNAEEGEIKIDYGLLRECVNSGILTGYNTEQLLKTLMNVEPLFSHLKSFSQFDALFKTYQKLYSQVANANQGQIVFPLKTMNLYSTYKVPLNEIKDLYCAICEINKSAIDLFGGASTEEQIQFANHFRQLRDFLDKRQNALANEEEKDLISRLLVRLETVQNQLDKVDRKGTLDDLRSGLYYFLKQKEEPVSDWFVRNFEQIDGDVLLSSKQNTPGREKTYHFACVSDKDMNRTVDELLPWPLSEMFIERAYNPKELPFQVYYAALGERSNFLRYALFYGLYFSQCNTKISFVKRYGEDATDYYEMLRLIGLKAVDSTLLEDKEEDPIITTVARAKSVTTIAYDQEQMAAMFLCPYRFLMDYVLNPYPIVSGSFLMQRFFVNLLIENTWGSVAGKNQAKMAETIDKAVDQEASKLERYFPFFISSEILDMKRQATNYLISNVLRNGNDRVRPLDKSHMKLRRVFGEAEFLEEIQDSPVRHTYPEFERLVRIKEGKKSYSTHRIPKTEDKTLVKCVLEYLNATSDNSERTGNWCIYCPDKGVCLSAYQEKNN